MLGVRLNSVACLPCRAAKRRCEGGDPCLRCRKRDVACSKAASKKRGRKPLKIEMLELGDLQLQTRALTSRDAILLSILLSKESIAGVFARPRDFADAFSLALGENFLVMGVDFPLTSLIAVDEAGHQECMRKTRVMATVFQDPLLNAAAASLVGKVALEISGTPPPPEPLRKTVQSMILQSISGTGASPHIVSFTPPLKKVLLTELGQIECQARCTMILDDRKIPRMLFLSILDAKVIDASTPSPRLSLSDGACCETSSDKNSEEGKKHAEEPLEKARKVENELDSVADDGELLAQLRNDSLCVADDLNLFFDHPELADFLY